MALNFKIFIKFFMSSFLAKKTLHRAVNLYIIKYVEYFSRLIKISLQILRRQCAPRHESDPRSARNFNETSPFSPILRVITAVCNNSIIAFQSSQILETKRKHFYFGHVLEWHFVLYFSLKNSRIYASQNTNRNKQNRFIAINQVSPSSDSHLRLYRCIT